jgi:hypothetical protein
MTTNQVVKRNRLAFVLLREAAMPAPEAVLSAFARIAPPRKVPALRLTPTQSDAGAEALFFELGHEGRLVVGLLPAPIPRQEAEQHADRSLASVKVGWKPEAHRAHLAVMWQELATLPAVESLKRYTWLLAAVADASKSIAVYWAESGATHHGEYFVEVAKDGVDSPLLVTLWSGLSVGADSRNRQRTTFVSLGMSQLDLPDLELSVPLGYDRDEAVGFFYELLAYTIERGAAIPEGNTVGRSPDERLKVRYVPSPIDAAKKVWRVDLPGE